MAGFDGLEGLDGFEGLMTRSCRACAGCRVWSRWLCLSCSCPHANTLAFHGKLWPAVMGTLLNVKQSSTGSPRHPPLQPMRKAPAVLLRSPAHIHMA